MTDISKKFRVLILGNFALLLFVLSIPGTIALRNSLAASLLLILIIYWAKAKISIKPILENKTYVNDLIVLLVITIYIFIHSIFIADELRWSLSQYRTQWVYPMIYFMMGLSLASMASINKYFKVETLISLLFLTLFIHVIYIDLAALFRYLETGTLLKRYGGLTESPVLSSYVVNILISMLIVEFIHRLKKKKRMLQISFFWLNIILFLCLFASIISGMRFGAIIIIIMSLIAFILIIIDKENINNTIKASISILLLILCALPLVYSEKNDVRWQSLLETIPIAIDTENNSYWRDSDFQKYSDNPPVLSDGTLVDHSNYMRIAWTVKGIEYIKNDIFGIGYGRNVFGHAIQKYEKGFESLRGSHSHSSIIDFTIGVGLIGLLLWLFFIGRIILFSTSAFIHSGNYFSLLSLFIASSFFIRSIVDSNMRDHMFKQFFLILGISITLAAYEYNKQNKDA